MRNSFKIACRFTAFGLSLIVCYSTSAQAKLVVTGAKINLANSVYLSTNDISLATNSVVTVASSTVKIAGTMASAGTFDVTNGTIETNGTIAQIIPANVFYTNYISNLTVNNSAGVTMLGNLALTNVLTLSAGTLASNSYLTLKSTSANTARVAPVVSTALMPVAGDVIVERYIPAKRAYRLLTAPVKSSTSLRTNWMENTNNTSTSVNYDPVPGFGTHISGLTGNAGGFDVTSTLNPSMFNFDMSSQTWVPISNTSGLFSIGNGSRIIVRGNRSTDLNSNTPSATPTTLRAKGTLATGTIVFTKPGGGGTTGTPQLSTVLGGYSLIGNPYASVLNWDALQVTDISSQIYIFDPTINGANSRGAFVSYNGTFHTTSLPSSSVDNNLQSGQAFLVQTIGPNPSITVKETHKASALRNVFRTTTTLAKMSVELLLPGQLNGKEAADGCLVFFANEYPSTVSSEDSYKFSNQDENLGILVSGQVLSIEGRQPLNALDTVFLKVWQLKQPDYNFRVNLTNFDPSIQAFLHDNYLQTNTVVNNGVESIIPFSITSDAASIAPNRFSIVFKNSSTLPVQLANITATEKNKGIEVDWLMTDDNEIDHYEVEKSAEGENFTTVEQVKADNRSNNYSWFDPAPYANKNYYRIKAVNKTGTIRYSKIVKVNSTVNENSAIVEVSANSNQLLLKLQNLKKGTYKLTLFSSNGATLHYSTLAYDGGVRSEVIKLNRSLPAGIYQLQLLGTDVSKTVSVLFK